MVLTKSLYTDGRTRHARENGAFLSTMAPDLVKSLINPRGTQFKSLRDFYPTNAHDMNMGVGSSAESAESPVITGKHTGEVG